MMATGTSIAYAESIDTVPLNMTEVQPTLVLSVPRLYEKMYARVLESALAGGGLKKQIFFWARGVADRWADVTLAGGTPGGLLTLQYSIAQKLVFSKLKARTGGQLRYFVSGGAGKVRKGDVGKNIDMFIVRFNGKHDPNFIMQWFVSKQIGEWNWQRWNSPEFDALFAQSAGELDAAKRRQEGPRRRQVDVVAKERELSAREQRPVDWIEFELDQLLISGAECVVVARDLDARAELPVGFGLRRANVDRVRGRRRNRIGDDRSKNRWAEKALRVVVALVVPEHRRGAGRAGHRRHELMTAPWLVVNGRRRGPPSSVG